MAAVVDCFKEWRYHLEGSKFTTTVISDHKNLEYFATARLLNRRQARWAEKLAPYDFKIVYRPGVKNGKADALSRRGDHALEEGGEPLRQPIT